MSLLTRISDAVKDAMRARAKVELGTLRLIMSEIKRVEIDERVEMTDERIITVLNRMVKQRRESVRQFSDAGRKDLVDKEQAEIDLIDTFLPEKLSDEAVVAAVDAAIAAAGAESMRDMGKVMGALQSQLSGQADMAAVSALVRTRLA